MVQNSKVSEGWGGLENDGIFGLADDRSAVSAVL